MGHRAGAPVGRGQDVVGHPRKSCKILGRETNRWQAPSQLLLPLLQSATTQAALRRSRVNREGSGAQAQSRDS